MLDILYGVVFAASLVGMLAVVLGWILNHKREPAFSTGLASMLSMFIILFALACRNANPADYQLWAMITVVVFALWGVFVITLLHMQHAQDTNSERQSRRPVTACSGLSNTRGTLTDGDASGRDHADQAPWARDHADRVHADHPAPGRRYQ